MKPSSLNKYSSFKTVELKNRTWPDKEISSAPIWCSVDLRDGNQALAIPMNISQKLELFELLVEIGFKEIEIGFPSASETEFNFVRKLVDENLIPEGVKLQCLVQAREHLIRRTFEAIVVFQMQSFIFTIPLHLFREILLLEGQLKMR